MPNPPINTTIVANIAAINNRKDGSIRPRWTPRAILQTRGTSSEQVGAEAGACPGKWNPADPDRRKQKNRNSWRPGFSDSARGRRIIGLQTLSACRIRSTTLSESVKIQNQKLPRARSTLRRLANAKRERAPRRNRKLSA
jgi:hypothetical protein